MEKIVIIGKKSFIGKNFQNLSKYESIDAISLIENKPEDVCFDNYNVILYLAAIVHQSKKIPEEESYKINRDLCINVAKLAKNAGIRQFIFLSTIKVYGSRIPGSGVWNENSDCYPDDAYGKSKYEAELGLKKLGDANFIVSIIRTPLVYGEGVKANMLRILTLVEKFSILPFGKVKNKRNITFTGNLVGFIDRVIEKKASGIFIAMDENPLSTTELVTCLARFLNKKIRLFKLPAFVIHIGSFFFPNIMERLYGSLEFDNNITKRKLNYKPPYSTKEGIEHMVLSYKKDRFR